jgi:hypothetical protein
MEELWKFLDDGYIPLYWLDEVINIKYIW